MRILDFKDLAIKDNCPVCGFKFKPYDGLMYHCNKKHFNGYDLSFGVKDSKPEFVYFDLKIAHENSRKHYLFFSFQLNFMLFADTKANASKSDRYLDLPFVDLDLSKIPDKKYKDYFKTLVIFG